MKIIDLVASTLTNELERGNLHGLTEYTDSPEHAATLEKLEQEDRQRFIAIEAAFNARQANLCDQYFRAGFAAGLQLAAETFNGLAEIEK